MTADLTLADYNAAFRDFFVCGDVVKLFFQKKTEKGANFEMVSRSTVIRRFVLSFLFTLALSAAVCAQSGHIIRGKVRTADGVAVAQAHVELQGGNGARIGQTTTSSEGDFAYDGLSETSFTIVVSSPDYQTASHEVRFFKRIDASTPGETQFVEVVLTPKKRASTPSAVPVFVQDVPPEARKKFEEAAKLLKDNKADKALPLLHEAVKLFPDYFEARLSLGSELAKAGRLNEAIVELEKARKVNPRDARLYYLFGMILMQKQMPGAAAEVLAEAVRLSPNDPQLPYLRATALIDSTASITSVSPEETKKKVAILLDAERSLLTAFDLSGKKLFMIHLQMARVFEKRNEPKRAADELEKYLRSSPKDKNAAAIRTAIDKLRGKS